MSGYEVAALKVFVAGVDVTDRMRPYLISVVVIDKLDGMDEAAVELDDSYGQLSLPAVGHPLKISMGWKGGTLLVVFDGVVSNVESGFSRESGRRLWIEGQSAKASGDGKTHSSRFWGEGSHPSAPGTPIPLGQVLTEAAGGAGLSMLISPALAGIARTYWSQNRESFFHFGQRLARELGGVFKIANGVASLTGATDFLNALGQAMTGVTAEWGKNLIQWRLKPVVSRPLIGKSQGEFFDQLRGFWKRMSSAVPGEGNYAATAAHLVRYTTADEDQADQESEGPVADSERRRGTGWVLIDGEPAARAGGECIVRGARPGVDGSYKIVEAEHSFSRQSGYLTRLDLEQPAGGVGSDPRAQE